MSDFSDIFATTPTHPKREKEEGSYTYGFPDNPRRDLPSGLLSSLSPNPLLDSTKRGLGAFAPRESEIQEFLPSIRTLEIESFSPSVKTLGEVRESYLSGGLIVTEELDSLINAFESWVKEDLYLVFENLENGKKLFKRASKRGNSIYTWKTRERLDSATSFFERKSFQKLLLRRSGRSRVSNVLFLTLTNDTKLWGEKRYVKSDLLGNKENVFIEGDRIRAWGHIQPDYNRFITAFRKKYGKTWALKCFESFENGYPHIHLLLITKTPWEVSPRRKEIKKKDGSVRWITEYRLKDYKKKKEISNLWSSGFVDIKSPSSVNSLRNYVYKDVVKQFKGDLGRQNKLSLTLNWLFRKRSFSVSGEKIISEFIREGLTQSKNLPFLEVFPEITFLGLVKVNFKNGDPPFFWEGKLSDDLEQQLSECILRLK